METITVLITGHVDGVAQAGWLKPELQKLLDGHGPFKGAHLRVKIVEVTTIDPEGGVRHAQTKAG